MALRVELGSRLNEYVKLLDEDPNSRENENDADGVNEGENDVSQPRRDE